MRCEVLLFAHLREAIGSDRLSINVDGDATVADVLRSLATQYEVIAQMRTSLAVAVNHQYQPMTARLTDGCTLALIPPVSGG